MPTDWNGSALLAEFKEDSLMKSTAELSTLLSWMNEIQLDIARRFDWPFLRFKGKKLLTASVEEQDLIEGGPGAPSVAASSGGSLTSGTQYKVKVTFVDSNGMETAAGTASSAVTPSGANLTITVSSIPVSSEALVSSRRVYVSKDGGGNGSFGAFYLDQTISDNTATTTNVTSETTSLIEPPDYHQIMKLDQNPFFEEGPNVRLEYRAIDQMRLLFQGAFTDGSPSVWSELGPDKVILYPRPSAANNLSFYYYKRPARIFNDTASIPDLPPELKPVWRAGVIMRAYEYKDTDGQESKIANYNELLNFFFSRYGSAANVTPRVRDVYGDSDGWES